MGLAAVVRNPINGKTYSISTMGHETAVFEGSGIFVTLNQKKNLRFSRSPRAWDLRTPIGQIHNETVEMVATQPPDSWVMTWDEIQESRDVYIHMPGTAGWN